MPIICLKVPSNIGNMLESINDLPRNNETSEEMHVTITYYDDVSIENLSALLTPLSNAISNFAPFVCTLNGISFFPKGDNEGIPIICPVESPEIHQLKKLIESEFDTAGISYSKKFPEFNPHVTLAYHNAEVTRIFNDSISWIASEIYVWSGYGVNDGVVVRLPLSFSSLIS